MNTLAERLTYILTLKGLIASDVAKATGITPPVLSRYLSGKSGASSKNLIKISQYLKVAADWLQNGSEAVESTRGSQGILTDKDKIIEVQGELIKNLQKQVKEWEDWKMGSKARHAKGREKSENSIKRNKQKMGFLKKHKSKK